MRQEGRLVKKYVVRVEKTETIGGIVDWYEGREDRRVNSKSVTRGGRLLKGTLLVFFF